MIGLDLVESVSTNLLEVEDRHYPGLDEEYILDDQLIPDKTWNAFISFIRKRLSIRGQRTIDKRKTLQTEYQLDVYGEKSVTIFIEENDSCNSIISPVKWILIQWLEQFPNSDEVLYPHLQCSKWITQKGTQYCCTRQSDHKGDCRFAN